MSALRVELLDILLKAASDCVGSLKVAVFGRLSACACSARGPHHPQQARRSVAALPPAGACAP